MPRSRVRRVRRHLEQIERQMAADSPELVEAFRLWSVRCGSYGTEVRGWSGAVILGGMAWWIGGAYGLLAVLVLGMIWAVGYGNEPLPLDDAAADTDELSQRSRQSPDDGPGECWLWMEGPLRF